MRVNVSWQSRLSAKLNIISQKVIDNSIKNSGVLTDVLIIRIKEEKHLDPVSIELNDITTTNMLLPKMEDIPLYRFLGSSYQVPDTASQVVDEEEEPIVAYAPVHMKIEQGSLIVRVMDYPKDTTTSNTAEETNPWILLYKVADVLGTFGSRSMVWQKLNLVYPTSIIDPALLTYIQTIANRRLVLKW